MEHATYERDSEFDHVSITLITGLIIEYPLGSLNVVSLHFGGGTPQGDFHYLTLCTLSESYNVTFLWLC